MNTALQKDTSGVTAFLDAPLLTTQAEAGVLLAVQARPDFYVVFTLSARKMERTQ